MKTAALIAACTFAVSTVHAEVELKAGVARVDITPTTLMQMYGYANRKCGPANGTHDPLFAKVLVLEAGDSRIAIVTMDLGAIVSEKLRDDVASRLNIRVLLLSVSHDHSAPSFLPYGSNPSTNAGANAYLAELEHKVFAAVEAASKSMFPAKLGVARGSLQLGYNRLLLRDDGRARALFDNMERVPYGPVDPEFVLLRVDDMKGDPKALLVHYAAHAVVLGPTNCKYSADYPGVMQSMVENGINGAQVMFVQGGAGDINPLFEARSGNEDADFKVVKTMGELLGAEVLRVNKDVKPLADIKEPFRWKSDLLTFNDRWDKTEKLDVGITTIMLGHEIAIAAIPGEPMHKLQQMWKEQSDTPVPLFYGYTYSAGGTWPGYIPDIRSAAYGGYGADVTTRIEVGAGEKIMLRHIQNLYELRGMWHDKPGKP
jgi:neutral ceramidase